MPRQILRIPLYAEPGVPDPALAAVPAATFLAGLLYSGLVKFTPDLHVIPELAVTLPTISEDERTYIFTIRQDARFADGRHCTAADVAYSLTRALSTSVHSPLAQRYLGNIEGAAALEQRETSRLSGVRVLDRLTVRIRLVRPDASFLDKLAFPVAYVVDRRVLVRYRFGDWIGRPAGTGPWVLSGRTRNGTLELAPRPHFYGGPLQLKSILLVPVASRTAALELYRKGDLDVTEVTSRQYAQLAPRSDFQHSAGLDAYYAVAQSRQAGELAASLDRDRLVQEASPELSPLSSIVPPAVPDYVASPPSLDPTPGPNGAPTIPSVVLQLASPDDWAGNALRQSLYRQWPLARRGGIPVHLIHASNLLPDPGVWLSLIWQQSRSSWYRSMLAESAVLTSDPVSRLSNYSRAETWALENAIIIPLASGSVAYLVKPAVQSLEVTPLGLMPANDSWASVSVS